MRLLARANPVQAHCRWSVRYSGHVDGSFSCGGVAGKPAAIGRPLGRLHAAWRCATTGGLRFSRGGSSPGLVLRTRSRCSGHTVIGCATGARDSLEAGRGRVHYDVRWNATGRFDGRCLSRPRGQRNLHSSSVVDNHHQALRRTTRNVCERAGAAGWDRVCPARRREVSRGNFSFTDRAPKGVGPAHIWRTMWHAMASSH